MKEGFMKDIQTNIQLGKQYMHQERVGKLSLPKGSATGFIWKENLLLTCAHAIQGKAYASNMRFLLPTAKGELARYKLSPDELFLRNPALDYCVVALSGFSKVQLPALELVKKLKFEALYMIHYPGGKRSLSTEQNRLLRYDAVSIYYEGKTAAGSSGAPVFNTSGDWMGMHKANVLHPEKQNTFYMNKAIRADRIVNDIFGRKPGLMNYPAITSL